LKTEFLLQFDGIGGSNDERILLLAATNRPFELDQAALRRLVKRIYIPLPEYATRISLLKYLLASTHNNIGPKQLDLLSRKTAGYSSSDLTAVAREAALGPVRELGDRLLTASDRNIRPIELNDFESALKTIRPSVSSNYISDIEQWNNERGIVGN
jgi:SpoVK/Ycf46/Vps4 family AAA+-type ATPase